MPNSQNASPKSLAGLCLARQRMKAWLETDTMSKPQQEKAKMDSGQPGRHKGAAQTSNGDRRAGKEGRQPKGPEKRLVAGQPGAEQPAPRKVMFAELPAEERARSGTESGVGARGKVQQKLVDKSTKSADGGGGGGGASARAHGRVQASSP